MALDTSGVAYIGDIFGQCSPSSQQNAKSTWTRDKGGGGGGALDPKLSP